jgi:hypothetical protein
VKLTDQIEAILSDLDRNEHERSDLMARLRAAARSPMRAQSPEAQSATPLKGRHWYVSAAEAFAKHGFPFDDIKVRRLCRKHSGDGGFAVKLGVWHVREPAFTKFCDRVERGLDCF